MSGYVLDAAWGPRGRGGMFVVSLTFGAGRGDYLEYFSGVVGRYV